MDNKVIREKKDLSYLSWSKYRHSSGTAGSFLKAYSDISGAKTYYKISAYDTMMGVIGHESVNEIIVDRLLTVLGIHHVSYRLIHADIVIDDKCVETYVCCSEDFKLPGERKLPFDAFFQQWRNTDESPVDFCSRMGWQDEIDAMLLTDYLILNRDRHGANLEVLKATDNQHVRLAPLYDHGVSLIFSCLTKEDVEKYDVLEDKPVQSFVGSRSTLENLKLIKSNPVSRTLSPQDKGFILYDLDGVLPKAWLDKIWEMIQERWKHYEDMQNKR